MASTRRLARDLRLAAEKLPLLPPIPTSSAPPLGPGDSAAAARSAAAVAASGPSPKAECAREAGSCPVAARLGGRRLISQFGVRRDASAYSGSERRTRKFVRRGGVQVMKSAPIATARPIWGVGVGVGRRCGLLGDECS